METLYPSTKLSKSTNPLKLIENKTYKLNGQFTFKNHTYDINQYLEDTRTEGLLIIHRDTIIYENYWNDLKQNENHISWSMAKSFMGTLIGIYFEKGLFKLDETVTKYLPSLNGSGYEDVTIKNLLEMSSGVRFDEDYGAFNSDINRFGRAFALGSSLEAFAKTLTKEKEQGQFNHYVSIDTQVLGLLLSEITGKSITELTQEHIWEPLGMEHDGYWLVDNENMEVVLGGLNASLRDFAKLGLLYKNYGKLNNHHVIDSNWVADATTPSAPHLMPGEIPFSSNIHGYGYQWWIPQNNTTCFAMGGIYNQYVYVDPVHDVVITKLSANHKFKKEGTITKDIHFVMFDEIIKNIVNNR
ncbi:MAG: serine hydrolase [Saprospiraceae bacterium]|nr:beta-lactamase family protein [Bacteroidia bacterium]NNE15232.1 serine hydrolase [Saprospiraceae bacterium]NNL93868.1 serine hydrolase [Saprospiraceae bacterium]